MFGSQDAGSYKAFFGQTVAKETAFAKVFLHAHKFPLAVNHFSFNRKIGTNENTLVTIDAFGHIMLRNVHRPLGSPGNSGTARLVPNCTGI